MFQTGRPLHKIADALRAVDHACGHQVTQRNALKLMCQLEAEGCVERVGSERFWRLTEAAEAEFGEALRSLREETA